MLQKRSITHAILALAVAFVAFAPAAKAGTYKVPFCDRSLTGSTSSWTHSNTIGSTSYFYMDNSCAMRRIYRRFVEGGSIPAGASDDWTFDAPAGTYVNRLDMYQYASPRSPGAAAEIYGWQQDGSRSLVAAAQPVAGSKVVKLRNSLVYQSTTSCAAIWNNEYGADDLFNGALVWLTDPSLPVFASVGGDGWVAEPSDGRHPITYDATDSGAGVKEARFYVDDALVSTNASSCSAEALVPCPLSTHGSFNLDTTKLAEGDHALKLELTDGSLNEETKQLSITVRRAPAPVDASTGSGPVSVSDTTTSMIRAIRFLHLRELAFQTGDALLGLLDGVKGPPEPGHPARQ